MGDFLDCIITICVYFSVLNFSMGRKGWGVFNLGV